MKERIYFNNTSAIDSLLQCIDRYIFNSIGNIITDTNLLLSISIHEILVENGEAVA